MKTTDLNVLRMAEAVIEVLKLFIGKMSLVPKLTQLYGELQALVASLHERNQQLVLGSGSTEMKQDKRNSLEMAAEELVSTIRLYANMENVPQVRAKVDLCYADLHKAAGDKLVDTCNELYSLATTLGSSLDGYLAATSTLSEFKQQVDAYAAVLSAPRTDISARSATRAAMEKTIADIRSLLSNKMDMAMNIASTREPEFYSAYTNARVIIDRKGKHRTGKPEGETLGMISGTLTDSATGEPIPDAILQLQGVAEASTTDEDGTFAFDQVTPGTHTLLCIKETYANLSLSGIDVKAGEETVSDGKMVKE
ncbi:MAG: carboxypeptidase-like regulatory domain-containing protein [Bacteroidota bacterium]